MSVLRQANSFAQVKQKSNSDLFADQTALSKINAAYDAIVGSAAQVLAGIATYSSLQSAIDAVASEGRILVLSGTFTGNVSVTKTVTIEGKGHGSKITGTMTFQTGVTYCLVQGLRISDNVTFSVGADANFFNNIWLAPTKTVTDGGSANNVTYIQE